MRTQWVEAGRSLTGCFSAAIGAIEMVTQVRRAVREGDSALHETGQAVPRGNAGLGIASRAVVGGVRGRG